MAAERTLWRDEAGGRFYLVPSGVTPARGTLLLRSGATRAQSVRAAAVARYEVSRDEARAFLDARLGVSAAEGKRKVEDALAGLGIPVPGADSAAHPSATPAADTSAADAPAEPGPGVRLFAALTGEAAETVGADREAFARGLGTLLDGAADLLRRASEGPQGEAEARERLRAFGETLRAHGIAPPQGTATSGG
jgi:hypothetical protein